MIARFLSILLLGALLSAPGLFCPEQASAELNVNINIGPPAHAFPAPPSVFFIPGTYVYYSPDVEFDIFFYGGYWYRPYEGRWFRARAYNGPWKFIEMRRVPSAVVQLPPDYRHASPAYDRIPYGQLKKNWKRWEREKYWDRQAAKKERRMDRMEDKLRHKEERREQRMEDKHRKHEEKREHKREHRDRDRY